MESVCRHRFKDADIGLTPGQLMPGTFYVADHSLEQFELGVLISDQQYSHYTAPRLNNMNIVIGICDGLLEFCERLNEELL